MKIGTPKEIFEGENRVALTPDSALQLQKLGYECLIESGAGSAAGYSDKVYKEAGVKIVKTATALWKGSEIICLLYTSPSPRDGLLSRMPSSA